MTCQRPITRDVLIGYWLGELSEAEEQAVEEHVFECDTCTNALRRISELVAAVRDRLPVSLTARAVEVMRKRLRLLETVTQPDKRADATWTLDYDLMVHRLQLPVTDDDDISRVQLEVCRPLPDGGIEPYLAWPDLEFERPRRELNVVCQRHFYDVFHDMFGEAGRDARLRVTLVSSTGAERVVMYRVVHHANDGRSPTA